MASELKLQRHALPFGFHMQIGSDQAKYAVYLASLIIGNMELTRVEFVVSPSPLFQPRVAVLGMMTFRGVDIELDLHNKRIALYSQDHCPGKVPYWTDQMATMPIRVGWSGMLYFPVELEGRKVEASISTSMSTSSLEDSVSRAVYGFGENSPDVQTTLNSAGQPQSYYRAMKLTASGFQITEADVMLTPSWNGCRLVLHKGPDKAAGFEQCIGRYPLLLGRDVLEKLHLYLATREGTLYLSAAEARAAGTGQR
jgi:hypothetical protein